MGFSPSEKMNLLATVKGLVDRVDDLVRRIGDAEQKSEKLAEAIKKLQTKKG